MSTERLILKGRHYNIFAIAQLGRVAIGNASLYPEELAEFGWNDDNTQALQSSVESLVNTEAARSEAQAASLEFTSLEKNARDEAKTLIRRIKKAVKIVTKGETLEGINESNFHWSKKLNSTPSILHYVERVVPHLQKLDSHLSRFFKGANASDLLTQAGAVLAEADTKQETARKGLPVETAKIHELKGAILEQVEELNAIASMAFDGQSEIAARFNKDLLRRKAS